MKVYIQNQQRLVKVNQRRVINLLNKALHLLGLSKTEISILFVNDRRMRILNRQYRGVDRTTDVLSFPQQEGRKLQITSSKLKNKKDSQLKVSLVTRHSSLILGDIVINLHQAKRQAAELGFAFNEELKKLLIHGLLHLIGYDHEKAGYQEKKMLLKERSLLEKIRVM